MLRTYGAGQQWGVATALRSFCDFHEVGLLDWGVGWCGGVCREAVGLLRTRCSVKSEGNQTGRGETQAEKGTHKEPPRERQSYISPNVVGGCAVLCCAETKRERIGGDVRECGCAHVSCAAQCHQSEQDQSPKTRTVARPFHVDDSDKQDLSS